MSKTPTRLELHKLVYISNGKIGELLSIDDLNEDERLLLANDIFMNIHIDKRKNDPYEICSRIFSEWGVMCPHRKIRDSKNKFLCQVCGSMIFNRYKNALKKKDIGE
jgi:hypothetical protein